MHKTRLIHINTDMQSLLLLVVISTLCSAFPDVDIPEQYATVLASNQFVPAQIIQSSFFGILYITVTPLNNPTSNVSANTFRLDTMLTHNVQFAVDAAVYGAGARGVISGAFRLFSLKDDALYPTTAPVGPIAHSVVVDEEIISMLRQGLLFGEITSNGQTEGQLRGQIESRNDIYFAPLYDPASPVNATGAALIRVFDQPPYAIFPGGYARIANYPLALDYYVLSSTQRDRDFIAIASNLSQTLVFDFGLMEDTVLGMVANFGRGFQLPQRRFIQLKWPMFGKGSSPMSVYAQNLLDGYLNITVVKMGQFSRLPLMQFKSNQLYIYNYNHSKN